MILKGTFFHKTPLQTQFSKITVVRLKGRKGRILEIEGIDVLDRTPLIKT